MSRHTKQVRAIERSPEDRMIEVAAGTSGIFRTPVSFNSAFSAVKALGMVTSILAPSQTMRRFYMAYYPTSAKVLPPVAGECG